MNITGGKIIKAGLLIIVGLFSYGVYEEYKTIREEEKREYQKECENTPIDEEVPVFRPASVSDTLTEAVTNTVDNIVESIAEDPMSTLEGVAIGAIASLCYIAGTNDGASRLEESAMRAIYDAKLDGTMLGFAGGRKFTREHVKVSNPETAEMILHNLDIYERLHKGSDAMKFNPNELEEDPEVMHHYNYMKEHFKVVED